MRRVFLGGAGVTLVFVLIAVTAASAVAAPPEFTGPFPDPYTGTSKVTKIETVGKQTVTCTGDKVKGQITGPASAEVQIDLTGCTTSVVAGVECNSPNGLPGEIQTEVLIGLLGYTNPETKEVGIDLMNPTGGPMAVFFCGAAVTGKLYGSVIGKVTPINKLGKGLHLTFAEKAGKQHFMNLFGGPPDFPMMTLGGPLEPAGIASGEALKLAVPTAIVA